MATYILSGIILLIIVFSVRSFIEKLRFGCCGGTIEKNTKRKKINKKELSEYQISKTIYIEGMTCGNCANHVENAINSLENVYAKVDLKKNLANVRMKVDISEEILKGAISKAGYSAKYIDEN